ncbi:MAG: carbohydrate kinase family protein [Anaerolineae bacterium]
MEHYDVIGLGYCSDDYLGIVPHITPFDGDTVTMRDFAHDGGGPVSTALVTLAKLGARTAYLGVLGDDESGQFLLQAFRSAGVDTRFIQVHAGGRSPSCIVLVEEGTGRRSIHCFRGQLPLYTLTEPAREALQNALFLHLDGHSPHAIEEAAHIIHRAGGQVVFDANRPRPQTPEILRHTDILIAAERFPAAFTGIHDLLEASRRLMTLGPRMVVTTLGPRGCLCVTPAAHFHVPGFSVPVVDTTGAGDAFHGAFIFGLRQQDWSLVDVARFANAVAAMNCRRLGGRAGLPTLEEALDFLRSAQ